MAVFAVLSEAPNIALGAAIAAQFGNGASYRLSDSQWLVSAEKLVKEIGDELGISKGELGKVAILRLDGPRWGWHDKALWEWLDLKMKQT